METTQPQKGNKLIVCLDDQNRNLPAITLENPSPEKLHQLNEQGFGIFETANYFFATNDALKSSGTKTKRQKEFLSGLAEVYADLDVCKEKDHLPENERETRKNKLKQEINSYCPATFYILTKNGLQPHWRINEPKVDESAQTNYKNVIKGIIEWSKKYGNIGDPVFDVTRVLRKPEFLHIKSEPYLVTEELGNDKTYTLDELKKFFWYSNEEKTQLQQSAATTEMNPAYQQINELDIKQVVVDAWTEKGHTASFDDNNRLMIDGEKTATFKGRLEGNYMATTSSDFPAKGNAVTYTAETLGISYPQALSRLQQKYNIKDTNKAYKLPKPITAEELGRIVFPPERWRIDQLVPENQITIISGSPSSFKTMSALEWAIKIAQGEPAYSNFKTIKSAVGYINEDRNHSMIIQDRLHLLSEKLPNNLFFWNAVGFSLEIEQINALLIEAGELNIKFIIFDSLRAVMPKNFDEMKTNDIREIIRRLGVLTNAGITILIIHHDRKRAPGSRYFSKDPNDIGEMMSGSADIRGAVDCHISMRNGKDKKTGEDYIIVTQTKCRQKMIPPFQVMVKEEGSAENPKLRLVYEGSYAPNNAEENTAKAKEAILELLKASSDKYVYRQVIIDNSPGGFKQKTIDEALKSLEKNDKSISSKTGKELNRSGNEARRKYYYFDSDDDDID
jgi:hypothetical protein